MDSEKTSIPIVKLDGPNFYVWRTKTLILLAIKDCDILEDDSPSADSDEYQAWHKKYTKARASMLYSTTDDLFHQVSHAETAKELFKMIFDIFEKQTLLNKLTARHQLFTPEMNDGETVNAFANRIRQYAQTFKSMNIHVYSQDIAMTFLGSLPDRFDTIISAIDAYAVDEDGNYSKFTFDFVLSRCQEEERRQNDREKSAVVKAETTALFAFRKKRSEKRGDCVHCGRLDNSEKCFWKYPHLAPPNHPARNGMETALLGKKASSSEKTVNTIESDTICLITYPEMNRLRESCLNFPNTEKSRR